MRIQILVILSSVIFIFSANSNPSLKTELSDENFMNRLRFTGEYTRLSLAFSINDKGFDWAEPSFVSPVISAGRMELKGLPRELFNPDGTAPGSSVFSENSRLRITDSFDRSSRFGITSETGVTSWIFRTNSGLISAGIVSTICNYKYFEADTCISAGTCPDTAADSWFADHSVLPGQISLNAAAELRFGTEFPVSETAENTGRRIMRNDSAGKMAAASFLAGLSMPEYTMPGFFVRSVFSAGSRAAGIRGLFQWVDDAYIPPSGRSASYRNSAGLNVHAGIYSEILEAVFSCGYFYRQAAPEVLPGKIIGQVQEVEAGIKLDTGVLCFNIDSAGSLEHDINGRQQAGADFDVDVKIYLGPVISNVSGGMDFDNIWNCTSTDRNWYGGAGLRIKAQILDCSFNYVYRDGEHCFNPGMKIATSKGKINASVEIINGGIVDFSAGFQSE